MLLSYMAIITTYRANLVRQETGERLVAMENVQRELIILLRNIEPYSISSLWSYDVNN